MPYNTEYCFCSLFCDPPIPLVYVSVNKSSINETMTHYMVLPQRQQRQ